MKICFEVASLVLFLVTVLSCSQSPTKISGNAKAGHSRVSGRVPADEGDAPFVDPPLVMSRDEWVYSWTNRPQASQDPAAVVQAGLEFGEKCVAKLGHTNDELPDCEGNGMAAGPGVYTCDNPFTSHDYGTTLLMIPLIAGRTTVGMATGCYTGGPASGGFGREITANAKFEALLYDFRASDFNTRAMVLRSSNIVDLKKVKALSLPAAGWKKWKSHASAVCDDHSSLTDVLKGWGDQMDFLAITFHGSNDPTPDNFETQGRLNEAGVAASLASDAVAMSEPDLEKQVKNLRAQNKEVATSLDGCEETETSSLRSCLALRIFVSLTAQTGSPSHPTFAWSLPTTLKALTQLGLAKPETLRGVKSHAALMKALTSAFAADRVTSARVGEAFACMKSVKAQMSQDNFELWGEDPQ